MLQALFIYLHFDHSKMAAGLSSVLLGCHLLLQLSLRDVICSDHSHHHQYPHQMYESSSVDYQQLEMPSVAGAKLVGIFEDDHKANAKGKAVKSGKHNYTYWPNHLNMEKRHYCKEVIFEDSGLRFVPSTKPSCMLGHDDDDRRHLQLKRQKRSTNTVCC